MDPVVITWVCIVILVVALMVDRVLDFYLNPKGIARGRTPLGRPDTSVKLYSRHVGELQNETALASPFIPLEGSEDVWHAWAENERHNSTPNEATDRRTEK